MLALLALAAAHAEVPAVAVFYDGPAEPLAEGYLDAHNIENLLGHFDLKAEILPLREYQPGRLARYRAGFFVGTVSGTRFPAGFLADVAASQKPFCWIGRHIASLVNTAEGSRRWGFSYLDYRDDLEFREVHYKGALLPKEDPDLNIVAITEPGLVEVRATAVNDEKAQHPYVLRRNQFWYFADVPFSYTQEGGRYLVFCDLLHDILGIDHPPQTRALARIEDVSAEIDPDQLRELADLLAARRIPYQIAVIPIFRNPAKGFEIYLSDRRSLVDAIHYMIARGGTPVMHGVTHQYRGPSGDDYEFWDEIGNRPIVRDSAELVLERLQLGLAECFSNGIFPVAFETPHYAASAADYRAMQTVFSLFNERTMATPDIGAIQYFPYPVVDRFGRFVVPENLGFLPIEDPDPKVLIERARSLRVVRDAVASFYFHPFLDPALLVQVVRGISELGYQFVSLREFGGQVDHTGRYLVRTSSGTARLAPKDEFWRLRAYDSSGKLVSEQVSPGRHSGPVEVAVAPPAGGWAALDCLPQAPQKADVPGWKARLSRWWEDLRPKRRALDADAGLAPSGEAWILWLKSPSRGDGHNQQSYRSLLETLGYRVKTVEASEFRRSPRGEAALVVVPQGAGSRLDGEQQTAILRYLAEGGAVVADGRQEWLSRLGFRWAGRRLPVATVVDVLFPEMSLRWQPEEAVERFTPPEGVEALMVDPQSKQVLALAGRQGAGRYLHLAVPLDPHTPDATSHYPYFAEYLAQAFQLRPGRRAARLEAYFDPGYREGANLERLAAAWRKAGIRAVYVAAWQFYREYSFDYQSFVRLCHRNGIAVYAWFIFPAVTPRMWEEHPEWRERTATGADGRVGWRYAMNFENPACFRMAMEWMKTLLEAHQWDGVNVTELNYDADFLDYLRPDRFVPMNDEVRAEFRTRARFDPAQLFVPASPYYHKRNPGALEKYLEYREDVVTRWHRRMLEELEPLRRARGWEVIVTMLDSLHSGYVRPALGVNSRRVVALMKDFEFTLQVEDPAEHWAHSPDRYRRFAETYRKLVPDARRLMFDVNVVPDRSVAGTALPSSRATGMELVRTVAAAASASGRVAIYSEYTVPNQDWAFLGAALAGPARVDASGPGWRVESPVPILLTSPEDRSYYLDGQPWPAISPDGVLAPPGQYRLSTDRPWFRLPDRQELPTRLLHLAADLLEARLEPTGIEFRYSSPGRAPVVLNQKPLEILIDGRRAALPVEPAGARHWAAVLPRGEHLVLIRTTTRAGIVVNLWGWLSASAIIGFGALTTVMMGAIYLHLRLRRKGTS